MIVTSSWDGYHCFYDLLKYEIIYQVEGPKANLSEAMDYLEAQRQLVSGSNGALKIYQ